LDACVIEKYRDKYINYDELKDLLYVAKSGKLKGNQEFYLLLDKSYFQCKNFAEEWLSTLESYQEYRPDIFSEALSLHQFVSVNQEGLRKIIKKHDKNIPEKKLYPTWRWKADFGMTQRTIDVLFRAVKSKAASTSMSSPQSGLKIPLHQFDSDEEEAKGENDDSTETGADGHAASLAKQTDSFVRQSTKYWVHSCDLPALCTVLAENLNVYVFGESGSPWTHISSVYLDNSNRECYGERIIKQSGARLVRLRTYNDDTRKVYVERKVHWDDWTGRQSSKDRFPIAEENVMQLLRGHAVDVPPKSKPLRDELQLMIREKKLYPTVRVEYNRVAFQPADHDHVRVSLDLHMRFLQERATHMEWRTPDERFFTEDEILFPYSIVEVKLREPYISNPPKWLEDLQKSSLLHKENSFSKYIHATYAFNQMEAGALQLREPCWWNSMAVVSPQMAVGSTTFDPPSAKSPKSPKPPNGNYAKLDGGPPSKPSWISNVYNYFIPSEASLKAGSEKPLKVEPKVLFAAERTFLSWFNAAVFVCSFGVAVATSGSKTSGGLMVGIGILLIFYALFMYMRRTKALLLRSGTGYYDQYGPVLLSLVSIGVFFAALLMGHDSSSSTSAPTHAPTAAPV
jgi:SPX domain protein involved in polyphosphate accumulation/uncharacterized membrane protein YidH (DUF202 family)